jgi:CHASE2 domain-containing sensor protein
MRRGSLIGCSVGVALFTVAWLTKDLLFFGNLSDLSRDFSYGARADLRESKRLRAPFVFVAIDDETFARLGRPNVTPRDRLSDIVDRVVAARPMMIVVDIDVGWEATEAQHKRFTAALQRLDRERIPTILVRQPTTVGGKDSFQTYSRTPYDELVANSSSLSWASAQMMRGTGGAVRRIRSWVPACVGGRAIYLVSAPLQVAARYRETATHPGSVAKFDTPQPNWLCTEPNRAASKLPRSLSLSARTEDGRHAIREVESIDYSLKWDPAIPLSSTLVGDPDGNGRPLYTTLSALRLLDDGPGAANTQSIRGSIVFIGTSHAGAPDLFDTPVGVMPGSFALLNHSRALIDFGLPREMGFFPNLVAMLILSLVLANAMILLSRVLGKVMEVALGFALSSLWWLFLVLTGSEGTYFTLALMPLLIGLGVLFLPDDP